ncbi:cytochrome P450 [Daldinia sp. FL1419]|nr:cytochrome P450 [Daldinia sp. FL1419]
MILHFVASKYSPMNTSLSSLLQQHGTWDVLTAFLCSAIVIGVVVSVLNYIFTISKYHYTQQSDAKAQLPPLYPSIIPVLGHLISFVWDNAGFFRRTTLYNGQFTSTRLSFFGYEVYLFQDRETIKKIWKTPTLSSPMSIQIYCLKYLFGLSERALAIYRADDSGPHAKAYPGSNVPDDKRIDYTTHHEFLRALSGPGLNPALQRYATAFTAHIDHFPLPNGSTGWNLIGDFQDFFFKTMGASLIESLFGPSLLRLSPSFVNDLIEFDNNVPWLARGLPSFTMPKPYRIRSRLHEKIKNWHSYARGNFDEAGVYDGDGDVFWGSKLIRNRHAILHAAGQTDNDIAASDLGLAFGLVTNTNPTAMMAAWHIFKDPQLLRRVRAELDDMFGGESIRSIDPKELSKAPLLCSIYAEVLRIYVKIYVMVNSQQDDIPLGRWKLPKGKIGLLNSCLSHMDPEFWNTKGGLHPVESFWADRFLIDPSDPLSGPINPSLETRPRQSDKKSRGKPFFSVEGLDSSWFPYGGGYSVCPGRHLAKFAIIYACAVLVNEFDIEFLTDKLEFDSWRFGLGMQVPKNDIPFRIRKRQERTKTTIQENR